MHFFLVCALKLSFRRPLICRAARLHKATVVALNPINRLLLSYQHLAHSAPPSSMNLIHLVSDDENSDDIDPLHRAFALYDGFW